MYGPCLLARDIFRARFEKEEGNNNRVHLRSGDRLPSGLTSLYIAAFRSDSLNNIGIGYSDMGTESTARNVRRESSHGFNLISKTPGSVRTRPGKRLFRTELRKLSLKLKGKCCLSADGGGDDSDGVVVVALDIPTYRAISAAYCGTGWPTFFARD